jgi:hypothetical protein
MSYTAGKMIEPFWAENSGFVTGRDPLGIQNSSITVYGRLLPGMTNLTQRVRYYSFYCWLLKEYDNLPQKSEKKILKHQYNFVRRAELIIAFLMVNKFADEQSVIGSDYAKKHIDDVYLKKFYNIQDGADKLNSTKKGEVYWDYVSGALGQYYAGSLISLDLIETVDKFFHIKNRGLELAIAFEKSVPEECRIRFLKLVDIGKINLKDIEALIPYSLNAIPLGSSEWRFLKDIFLADDAVEFKTRDGAISNKRRQSMELYLSFRQEKIEGIDFTQWIHDNLPKNYKPNSALFGWYYYYINEALHFSLETIFWAFLENLDGKIVAINMYLDEFKKHIVEENSKNLKISHSDKLIDVINTVKNSKISQRLNELEQLTQNRVDWKIALGKAIELIMIIYKHTRRIRKDLEDFENYNAIDIQKGNVTENLLIYIEKNLEFTYSRHVEKLIQTLINDHVATAYRKMGNGETNLLKFTIEDNVIAHIQTMQPRHTTPRIRTLHKFLTDLGFLNTAGTLTNRGIKLLEEIALAE